MTRIIKTDTAWLYCKKCKNMEEHRIYLKADGTEVKHCLKCRHEKPYAHEIYGRQQPTLDLKKEKKQQYGRIVA